MIEMIYKATCDNSAHSEPEFIAEYSRKDESILREFMKRIAKLGWARVGQFWYCPACVRNLDKPAKKRKRDHAES
jgi:hypothetical protein